MKRVQSLDALRGTAALVVIFYHCTLAIEGARDLLWKSIVLRPLISGKYPVLIFFALSGFVLYITFDSKDKFNYKSYIVKRIIRIYPPMIMAIAISIIAYIVVGNEYVPGTSIWASQFSWECPVSIPILLGHVLLLDGTNYQSFDNVIWSLAHEMRISFIFPLIALSIRRSTAVTLVITFILSRLGVMLKQPHAPGTIVNIFATVQYIFLFAAGAALAKHFSDGKALLLGRRGHVIGLTLVAVSIVGSFKGDGSIPWVGAIALVAVSAYYAPVVTALHIKPLIWLGKVSYSIYLLHVVVLMILLHGLHQLLPLPVIVCMVPMIVLPLSAIFNRYIVVPSTALGRAVAAHKMLRTRSAVRNGQDPEGLIPN